MHNSRAIDTSACSNVLDEEIEIQTFSTCSIYCLKQMIFKQIPGIPVGDQILTYHGQTLDNSQSLFNYKMTHNALPTRIPSNAGLHEQNTMGGGIHSSSGGCSQDKQYFEINLIAMRKKKKLNIKGVVPPLLLNIS